MKIAIMQPYLFPYIGYFQLIYASDLFLIYDDVAYIKQGYINRNSINTANGVTRFTLPVPGASSNKLISELEFSRDTGKVIKLIEQSYAGSPYFDSVMPIVKEVLELSNRSIATVCERSFELVFAYIGVRINSKKTSALDYDRSVSATEKLIQISKNFGARTYVNPAGGRTLYNTQDFSRNGLELKFIEPLPIVYEQNRGEFVSNLSIIDCLMNCSPEEIVHFMCSYKLVD